jgi:hypothetical protein
MSKNGVKILRECEADTLPEAIWWAMIAEGSTTVTNPDPYRTNARPDR